MAVVAEILSTVLGVLASTQLGTFVRLSNWFEEHFVNNVQRFSGRDFDSISLSGVETLTGRDPNYWKKNKKASKYIATEETLDNLETMFQSEKPSAGTSGVKFKEDPDHQMLSGMGRVDQSAQFSSVDCNIPNVLEYPVNKVPIIKPTDMYSIHPVSQTRYQSNTRGSGLSGIAGNGSDTSSRFARGVASLRATIKRKRVRGIYVTQSQENVESQEDNVDEAAEVLLQDAPVRWKDLRAFVREQEKALGVQYLDGYIDDGMSHPFQVPEHQTNVRQARHDVVSVDEQMISITNNLDMIKQSKSRNLFSRSKKRRH